MISYAKLSPLFLAFGIFIRAQESPQHLVPIPAYSLFTGAGRVYPRLVNDDWPVAFMIGLPSSSKEYAVVLSQQTNEFGGETRYFLEHAVLIGEDEASPMVDRKQIEIPSGFAAEIGRVWEVVLRGTRYPPKDESGRIVERVDGDTFRFYHREGLFGEAWSPEAGSAKAIVDLGQMLIQLIHTDPPARGEAMRQWRAKAAKHFGPFRSRRPGVRQARPNHSMHSDGAAARPRR